MERRTFYTLLYGVLIGLLAAGAIFVIARRPAGQPIVLQPLPTVRPVRVDVAGAVAAPGVYALPPGSIWQEAIATAGGLAPNADAGHLNLAQVVQAGEQILVPALTPTAPPTRTPTKTPTVAPSPTLGPGTPSATPSPTKPPAAQPTSASSTGSSKININTATVAELDALPRIGPAIAQRIVDYRTANGPFNAIEDLMKVKGIGPATFEQLKDLITVGP